MSQFEGWPKTIVRSTRYGYKAWAIQNKRDGHCIYDAKVIIDKNGKTYAKGKSESSKFGHGSTENKTIVYDSLPAFEAEWGMK